MFREELLASYTAQCEHVQRHLTMAISNSDPEGIHEMRVGIKQLRAFFTLIEALAPTFWAKAQFRPFRRLFKAAAELRDVHVQQELARQWMRTDQIDLSVYYNTLKQRELAARRGFARFARHFDLDHACQGNARRIEQTLNTLSAEEVEGRLRQRIARLLSDILAFGQTNRLRQEHLHPLRILTKETRYTLQVATRCLPESGQNAELDQQLRDLHQTLGAWHDTEIADAHLRDFQREFPDQDAGFIVCDHLATEKAALLQTFEERWQIFVAFCVIGIKTC
jgi:CHAD domain-containing protein